MEMAYANLINSKNFIKGHSKMKKNGSLNEYHGSILEKCDEKNLNFISFPMIFL